MTEENKKEFHKALRKMKGEIPLKVEEANILQYPPPK